MLDIAGSDKNRCHNGMLTEGWLMQKMVHFQRLINHDDKCTSRTYTRFLIPKVKFVCGADFLESFATPNLWLPEDVSVWLNNVSNKLNLNELFYIYQF